LGIELEVRVNSRRVIPKR